MPNIGKQLLGLTLLLFGLALGGTGLWLLLSPAQYAATARIKVEWDVMMDEAEEYFQAHPDKRPSAIYDYYSYEPTIEKIKSECILTNVADQIHLHSDWRAIRGRLSFRPVRNTKLLEITYKSPNPREAADVANAIAEVYRDYRIQARKAVIEKGIEVLSAQSLEEEKKIQASETNLNLLRDKYGIDPSKEALWEQAIITPSKEASASEQTAAKAEYERAKPFWDAKRELIQMIEQHRLLAAKIEMVKSDSQIPRPGLVQIFDQATTPQKPVGPNRFLGLALSLAGFASLLAGYILLKSSRRQTTQ